MELNNDLITQFAKITKFNTGKSATTVRGTIRKSDDRAYIQIDGADEGSMTPVETVVEIADGDRVIATVKDHSVIVTGNKTNPAIGTFTAESIKSEITRTASEIKLKVEQFDKSYGEFTVKADSVTTKVENFDKSYGEFKVTADSITGKVEDFDESYSEFKQTANSITSKVEDFDDSYTEFKQTATEISSKIVDFDGDYSEFKQSIDGVEFTTKDGTTYIKGSSIETGSLNLSGAITWDDLDDDAQDTIKNAQDTAEAAEKRADEAYELAKGAGVDLPDYIKSTYIDSTTIESPNIIGGQLYAVGSDPEESSTFTTMDENGFYLYSDTVEADINNEVYPKISMICDTGFNATPMIILGSGESDEYQYHNRFVIEKGTSYVDMMYIFNYSYPGSGFTFNRDGTIKVYGELRGNDGLFPIGYIYLSFDNDDDNSPMSLFGGAWTRLEGYFLYAGGSSATMHDTGNVVTAGGTNTAKYIKLAAWERVA